jgi:hypothetical protein
MEIIAWHRENRLVESTKNKRRKQEFIKKSENGNTKTGKERKKIEPGAIWKGGMQTEQ